MITDLIKSGLLLPAKISYNLLWYFSVTYEKGLQVGSRASGIVPSAGKRLLRVEGFEVPVKLWVSLLLLLQLRHRHLEEKRSSLKTQHHRFLQNLSPFPGPAEVEMLVYVLLVHIVSPVLRQKMPLLAPDRHTGPMMMTPNQFHLCRPAGEIQ